MAAMEANPYESPQPTPPAKPLPPPNCETAWPAGCLVAMTIAGVLLLIVLALPRFASV
jgi:hypothetical protein